MTHNDLRIPVTLLSGFLGEGKTTLLNAILCAADGPNIAVNVDEFGETGLASDIVANDFMARLRSLNPTADILQDTGTVHLKDIDTPFVFHAGQQLFDAPTDPVGLAKEGSHPEHRYHRTRHHPSRAKHQPRHVAPTSNPFEHTLI